MRRARVRREQYRGEWLPEPLIEDPLPGAAEHAETADSLSLAFLVLLETLSPVQRAVFLLHDVFDYDHGEIAAIVGKSEENCRQLAARARSSLSYWEVGCGCSARRRLPMSGWSAHTSVPAGR